MQGHPAYEADEANNPISVQSAPCKMPRQNPRTNTERPFTPCITPPSFELDLSSRMEAHGCHARHELWARRWRYSWLSTSILDPAHGGDGTSIIYARFANALSAERRGGAGYAGYATRRGWERGPYSTYICLSRVKRLMMSYFVLATVKGGRRVGDEAFRFSFPGADVAYRPILIASLRITIDAQLSSRCSRRLTAMFSSDALPLRKWYRYSP